MGDAWPSPSFSGSDTVEGPGGKISRGSSDQQEAVMVGLCDRWVAVRAVVPAPYGRVGIGAAA